MSEPVEIEGEVRAETDLAYLFFDGAIETWLPKSLCEWDEPNMTMPEWVAIQKGLV